jgi:hypothetical protein
MARTVINGSAAISACGKYRWWLRRQIDDRSNRTVCFVMLNPSTADADADDPTIRRCIEFARSWGYSILSVRNLFAYRATDPRELKRVDNPIGGATGDAELRAARTADLLVAGWGQKVPFRRADDAERFFAGSPVYCLGKNKDESPRHPLYVPAAQPLVPFWNCTEAPGVRA